MTASVRKPFSSGAGCGGGLGGSSHGVAGELSTISHSAMLRSRQSLSHRTIGDLVIKRFALVTTTLAVLATFATAAIASGRNSRHRHSAGRPGLALDAAPDQVLQWNQELQKVLVAP